MFSLRIIIVYCLPASVLCLHLTQFQIIIMIAGMKNAPKLNKYVLLSVCAQADYE